MELLNGILIQHHKQNSVMEINQLTEIELWILKVIESQPYSNTHPRSSLTAHEIYYRIKPSINIPFHELYVELNELIKKGLIEAPDTIVKMSGTFTTTSQGYQLTSVEKREEYRERNSYELEILLWQAH